MLKVDKFIVSGKQTPRFFDNEPSFAFTLSSDKQNDKLSRATISVGAWKAEVTDQSPVIYGGQLRPFERYDVSLEAENLFGEKATANTVFYTAKAGEEWLGKWIADGKYVFKGEGSPKVQLFRRSIKVRKTLKRALIVATALGVYTLDIDGERVGEDFFAPGFTSYKQNLQYQVYDVTDKLKDGSTLTFTVAGGWAVGDFTYGHKNRVTASRQAIKAEIRLEYVGGMVEIIPTDESWQVATSNRYLSADLYDGEVYDATKEEGGFHNAVIERPKTRPKNLTVAYGEPVRLHEAVQPKRTFLSPSGEQIVDFGANFAGVVKLTVKNGRAGQKITLRHAEEIFDGELCVKPLRGAKCRIEYVCRDGEQTFLPSFTYMGFRYVGLGGADIADVTLTAYKIYSDIPTIGEFTCSDERLNKLQRNIVASALSNFVEIPTDCPQRDERMGWTGDIALFADTACFNFDMQVFLRKWLADMRAEQTISGGFPNTVPSQGHGFPLTMPNMAVDFWGDACVLVPWALYESSGDRSVLSQNYPMMERYFSACKRWAGLMSFGKNRYIWKSLSAFHFGDWVAPDTDSMAKWQARHPFTATASLANTARLLSKISAILENSERAEYYQKYYLKVCDAFESVLTDGHGKIKGEQFQTAYVLGLKFGLFKKENVKYAVDNLVELLEKNDYCVGTGFPGTPYLLFALAENGRKDVAYKVLFNEKCPSWLYEVKTGATTTWERWDALKEDGTVNFGESDGTGGMISFNHYALGAVGNFIYKNVLGVTPIDGGYKKFAVKPDTACGLKWAKGKLQTPFGEIKTEWAQGGGDFGLKVTVPFGAECNVVLPDGKRQTVGSGEYDFKLKI